jgi:hypothetical protein
MRATLYGLIVGIPAVTALIPAERWFQAGAVTDVPLKPFGVVRWLSPVSGAAKSTFLKQVRIDVHDERGDYSRIDAVLAAIGPVLSGVTNQVGPDGRIDQMDFLGLGGDQEDDTYNTNYSFSSWQLIGVSS